MIDLKSIARQRADNQGDYGQNNRILKGIRHCRADILRLKKILIILNQISTR
jgi:ribosomal protein L7Ae-like RNA K-turn-binding protein